MNTMGMDMRELREGLAMIAEEITHTPDASPNIVFKQVMTVS
jgi:hypothetical protein